MIGKREFVATAFDLKNKAFVIHIASISQNFNMHPSRRAQIALFKVDETFTSVSFIYVDFTDVFSGNLAVEHLKYTVINNYAIDLIEGHQLAHGSIYTLRPVKLKILKTYIKTNLANSFIKPSKSPANTPIVLLKNSIIVSNYMSITKVSIT